MQVFSTMDENDEMRAVKVLPTEHARQEIIGLDATRKCRYSLKMCYHLVSSPNFAELHRYMCIHVDVCNA